MSIKASLVKTQEIRSYFLQFANIYLNKMLKVYCLLEYLLLLSKIKQKVSKYFASQFTTINRFSNQLAMNCL